MSSTIDLFNLPTYRLTRAEQDDHDVHLYAEVCTPASACIHCHEVSLEGFGRRERHIKDLPMQGKRVGLYVDTRRYRCKACRKTFYEPLPDLAVGRDMTARLAHWIGKQSLKRTFLTLAEETGIDEKTVRNIFADFVIELEKQYQFETPKIMGIDEIHLTKPRGVITNIGSGTLLDLLPNRNKETIIKYLAGLKNPETIEIVAMDMWRPYRDAVELVLPHAMVVVDKFHVIKMANEAMEKARKGLRESLTDKQRRGLMHDRYVLLKRKSELTDKDYLLMDGWTKNYPLLGSAYALKEAFYDVYEATDANDAYQRYGAWRRSIPPELVGHFSDLVRAFENWQPYILNYFECGVTNAYTESLNNLIRVFDRAGRGYSFDVLRAKIIFTEGAHKHKLARPKFDRKPTVQRQKSEPITIKFYTGMDDNSAGYGIPEMKPEALPKPPMMEAPKNYGVDIEKMLKMLENGEL